jgi:hypothetical protein
MEAKLGGAGLGLVALVRLAKMQPGAVPIDEGRRLGQFVAFLQRGDGSFYSKYIPSNPTLTPARYIIVETIGKIRAYAILVSKACM